MQRSLLLAGAMAGCLAPLALARADASLEYAVKAAYLPKFIPFITWPDAAFVSPSAPVTICLLGSDPFRGKLEQATGGLKSGDREIVVRHMSSPDVSVSCQLIFLGPSDPAVTEGTLDSVKDKPVVTVTDSGLKARGVISFLIDANHVRFDIDNGTAARNGIVISSKLLSLAHAVKQRSQP